jgi:hypothetical protein
METILDIEIEGCKELTFRKIKAAAAFSSLNKLRFPNLLASIEMKIHNGAVLPHFLHRASAIVLKRFEIDNIEAQYRSHSSKYNIQITCSMKT